MVLLNIAIILGTLILLALLLWWWIRVRFNTHRSLSMVFLKVMIPIKDSKEDKEKDNEMFSTGRTFKEVADLMTHFFEALHGVYQEDYKYILFGQNFFSCEYVILDGLLHFYIVIPEVIQSLVEKHITAFYPDASIEV